MANQGEEDLVASKTEGFKLGDKKTVEEYAKLGEPKILLDQLAFSSALPELISVTANLLYCLH